jgi:hypothetical protein
MEHDAIIYDVFKMGPAGVFHVIRNVRCMVHGNESNPHSNGLEKGAETS